MYSVFKYLLYAYLLSSYKSLPLAYYVRFYWQAFKNLILPIYFPSFLDKNSSPFQTKTIHTYNSPFECDIYLHKSNSTYFEELDISRTKLMTLIFQKFFIQYKTESGTWAYVPVANVFTSFKKEIKPYQKYDVKSRILGWDSKWIFILSKFESGQGLHAVSVTKYVLKDKRKTIAPVKALEFCGYDVKKYSEESRKGVEMVDWFIETGDVEKLEI